MRRTIAVLRASTSCRFPAYIQISLSLWSGRGQRWGTSLSRPSTRSGVRGRSSRERMRGLSEGTRGGYTGQLLVFRGEKKGGAIRQRHGLFRQLADIGTGLEPVDMSQHIVRDILPVRAGPQPQVHAFGHETAQGAQELFDFRRLRLAQEVAPQEPDVAEGAGGQLIAVGREPFVPAHPVAEGLGLRVVAAGAVTGAAGDVHFQRTVAQVQLGADDANHGSARYFSLRGRLSHQRRKNSATQKPPKAPTKVMRNVSMSSATPLV
nr:MAG TPA: hypothetical protein [Caudoviricetes sp.]